MLVGWVMGNEKWVWWDEEREKVARMQGLALGTCITGLDDVG